MKESDMNKVAVLYICTGKYDVFGKISILAMKNIFARL